MGFILNKLFVLLILIVILSVIILVHEFGHFIWAKHFGVHIYEFSIGMGPILHTHKGKDKIDYNIRAFPIGGFVAMAGEVYDDDDRIPKKKMMCNKPWHQRLIVLVAGVVNNFILAIVLLFAYGLIWGAPTISTKVVNVPKNYPAYQAGIRKGDTILKIDNHSIKNWDTAQIVLLYKNKHDYNTFLVKHSDGKTEKIKVTPIKEKKDNIEGMKYGIEVDSKINKGILASLKFAPKKFASIMSSMWATITGLFSGKISIGALSGPVGIYKVVEQGKGYGLSYIIYLVAFLSINVGFINILPFPAFDGGHVLFMIIEKIRGKKIDSKIENAFHTVGFVLLLILMIFITCKDIIGLF